ncbi:hypothetical protein EVAR_7429_1 [Eumeta japonica]|uniref:Uncharacterized protein n=1 Tax=Eumeta variegata TaxID=151549 RepID=A0A4C1V7E0_EUMVA|nr:hypothetical protein EVAR_7429_1 [Eumeta japonica]
MAGESRRRAFIYFYTSFCSRLRPRRHKINSFISFHHEIKIQSDSESDVDFDRYPARLVPTPVLIVGTSDSVLEPGFALNFGPCFSFRFRLCS